MAPWPDVNILVARHVTLVLISIQIAMAGRQTIHRVLDAPPELVERSAPRWNKIRKFYIPTFLSGLLVGFFGLISYPIVWLTAATLFSDGRDLDSTKFPTQDFVIVPTAAVLAFMLISLSAMTPALRVLRDISATQNWDRWLESAAADRLVKRLIFTRSKLELFRLAYPQTLTIFVVVSLMWFLIETFQLPRTSGGAVASRPTVPTPPSPEQVALGDEMGQLLWVMLALFPILIASSTLGWPRHYALISTALTELWGHSQRRRIPTPLRAYIDTHFRGKSWPVETNASVYVDITKKFRRCIFSHRGQMTNEQFNSLLSACGRISHRMRTLGLAPKTPDRDSEIHELIRATLVVVAGNDPLGSSERACITLNLTNEPTEWITSRTDRVIAYFDTFSAKYWPILRLVIIVSIIAYLAANGDLSKLIDTALSLI